MNKISASNTGVMKLTEKKRSTQRETCPNVTLSTINPTSTSTGSNADLSVERPTTSATARPLKVEFVGEIFGYFGDGLSTFPVWEPEACFTLVQLSGAKGLFEQKTIRRTNREERFQSNFGKSW
jgi:hypothetical protein